MLLRSIAKSPVNPKKPAKKPKVFSLASVALVAGTLVCVAALANGMRTTKDGVFTAEQAERGKKVYEQSCKNCHQAEFYVEKLTHWQNKSVNALFEAVSTSMPADNVGSLATSEYVDVLAYVFSITGSPSGGSELTADNLESVKIAAAK